MILPNKSLSIEPNCSICGLQTSSTQVVVSRGSPSAKLMIIGEAPGAKEEEIGEPFVGRSGTVLNGLLESVGIDWKKEVFITNVIKCRPPDNRRPSKSEIDLALPWLYQQIQLVDPCVILLVGSTALRAVLATKTPISKIRGSWQSLQGRFVMAVFHPSYLLRNPSKEEGKPFHQTRLDLLEVRKKLNTF